MDTDELLSRFAVALGIGLLIGLERGWRARDEKPGSRAAGFRTFAISALLGGVVGALALAAGGSATAGGGAVIGIGLAAFAAVITVFCLEENRADKTSIRRPRRLPPFSPSRSAPTRCSATCAWPRRSRW